MLGKASLCKHVYILSLNPNIVVSSSLRLLGHMRATSPRVDRSYNSSTMQRKEARYNIIVRSVSTSGNFLIFARSKVFLSKTTKTATEDHYCRAQSFHEYRALDSPIAFRMYEAGFLARSVSRPPKCDTYLKDSCESQFPILHCRGRSRLSRES